MTIRNAALRRWHARGQELDVFGRRVFVVDANASDNALPPLLVLHGFPTSSHDFSAALPRLSQGRRVVLFDFLGFGLSEKNPQDTLSLLEQAEVALEVWRQLDVTRGHLLAHDYGTSVATELLARRERGFAPVVYDTVTLCNGSMHIELAQLSVTQKILRSQRAGQWLARLGTRGFFGARMRKIFGQRDAVDSETIDALWAAIRHDDGHLRLPTISQYLHERHRFWHRWIGALCRLDRPCHVLWGRLDPIAVPAIAEQLQREMAEVTLTWLPKLGHYPMLEDPIGWADAVAAFVDQADSASAQR